MEMYRKWRVRVALSFQIVLLLQLSSERRPTTRRCKRLPRLHGWWNMVWTTFDDKRFKESFRVTRATFLLILNKIKPVLVKESITEDPMTPMMRLAVCLYRLARGDYLHTISELVGLGKTTVCLIVKEVCEALVSCMWHEYVSSKMATDLNSLREVMESFDQEWQFQCCFRAVDGCHIPIKCPNGGAESAKEYHNFKNFYSIIIMAIANAKHQFTWASSGYPGNNHDSMIFQSTTLDQKISDAEFIPKYSKKDAGMEIYPMLIGDSAFPFMPWLMKPYGNAILTEQQRYFNYRLSTDGCGGSIWPIERTLVYITAKE